MCDIVGVGASFGFCTGDVELEIVAGCWCCCFAAASAPAPEKGHQPMLKIVCVYGKGCAVGWPSSGS